MRLSLRHPLFWVALLLLGVFLWQSKEKKPTLAPLPQDPQVQVYFNHNLAHRYQDPYRHFLRFGDDLEALLIAEIEQAQKSIDIAVMELRLPLVAQALLKQQQKGVKVRLIVDNKYNKALGDYTATDVAKMNAHERRTYDELKRYPQDALALLKQQQISLQDDTYKGATKGSGIMHHKFAIFDGKNIIVSSGNFTNSEFHGDFNNSQTRGNPNNLVVIKNHAELAAAFREEFNYMWRGLFKSKKPDRLPQYFSVGQGSVTVYFSSLGRKSKLENTGSGVIASFLGQAKSSIYIAVFVYSDPYLAKALEKAQGRGVGDIRVLIDRDFYRQYYSNAYAILGLCHPEKPPRSQPWGSPLQTIGYPLGVAGDRGVHSKIAILDQETVITGSQNWSVAANYRNDETILAIHNPVVARHYRREFDRLYQSAVLGAKSLPQARPCTTKVPSVPREERETLDDP